MTSKLDFLKAACVVFNCTPSVVLNALSERSTQHPKVAAEIKRWAEHSCNASTEEWKALAQACDTPFAQELLFAVVTGADIRIETTDAA